MIRRNRSLIGYSLIFLFVVSYALPIMHKYNNPPLNNLDLTKDSTPSSSAQRSVINQWIKNPTFESPIEPTWYWENGTEGDNSDMDASTSTGQANYDVLGETRTFTLVSGTINSSTSPDWLTLDNTGRTRPDTALINSDGCYVSHFWNDDANQFPSVHWKTNLSTGIDMSDYVITSASLEVIVNATVQADVDTPNDDASWEFFAIGDSVTFYSQITDLGYNSPIYTVASNKTKYLGQQNSSVPTILTLSDSPLETVSQNDLISSLNSAFNKDPDHSNLTLTLGIDIYSEDNLGGADPDNFDDLLIKTCNLTFTVKKKIDQSTSVSWNQVGNQLSGSTMTVTDAKFFFKYKVNATWPSIAPLSEIRFMINNKTFEEGIIKLTSATTSFQEAKVGGFDVTNLISTDVNITTSIEVFLKDTFELGQGLQISIDDVYLNISYTETFPDYGTDLELFLNTQDKTLDPVIQIPINDLLNITVTYKHNETGNHISTTDAQLEGKVSQPLTENPTLEQYYTEVNTTDLDLGISVLTVTIQKTNYESQSIQIFVEVIERETELQLLIDNTPRQNNETIDTRFNELLNITVFYTDNLTFTHISGASVDLLGFGLLNEISSQFNFMLDTNDLSQGVNILTIFAQKSNYQSQTIQFYLVVVERATELFLYVESFQKFDTDTVDSQFDETLNITVIYRDDITKQHINSAAVSLLGHDNLTETTNQYTIMLDTNDLSEGVNILTIYAQKNNYQSQSIQIFVNILVRATYLRIFVENIEKNDGDTITTQFYENLNITALFRDDNTDNHLAGASVDILGFGNFNEISSQFNFTLSTNILDDGINILTIFAQLDGYQDQTFQLFMNVSERVTELLLYVNENQEFDSNTIVSQFDEFLNITILYRDDITKQHIANAYVNLLGFDNLTENFNQYTLLLDTDDLSQGINVLTILSFRENYESKTIQIFVDVQERETYLNLFVEGIERFDSDTINTQFDEYINISIFYRDTLTGGHLSGASVDLLGIGNFTEIGLQFNYSINTNLLEKGINILTVFAQLDGHKPQVIQFFINVDDRETGIYFYINGFQMNQSDTIKFEANELINITVYFEDYLTSTHLSGANIELLGMGLLDETANQYNITINSNDLSEGINILTIFAQLTNYQPKSIQFFIEVVERATQLQLFLNGQDETVDPVIDLPIGSLLNITIKYYDNRSGLEISGAIIQLIGESLYQNLTENIPFNQYTFIINTSILLTGIKLFTIVAQAADYQINTIDIRINVNRISTSIDTFSGERFVSIDPQDDYRVQIVFNNTDFGGTIKNASLTFRWENGQGQLLDPDNDGIYEIVLNNIPAGTYIVSISAFAGDDYEFQSLEIVLNVVAPPGPDIILLLIMTAAGVVGLSVFMVLYFKVLKYPPKVRKMRKLKKKIDKSKKLKPLTLQTRDQLLNNRVQRNKELFNIQTSEVDYLDKTKKGGELLE